MKSLCGVILAGGYSSRMGLDKVSLSIANKTMLERTIHCLESITPALDTILISCRHDAPIVTSYPLVLDRFTGIGPIAGIYSALLFAKQDCLFIPVDIPTMQSHSLETLITAYYESPSLDIDMICFRSNSGIIESLISIISASAIHDIHTAIQNKSYKITHAIQKEKQVYLPYPSSQESFYNVNTPHDLAHVQQFFNK